MDEVLTGLGSLLGRLIGRNFDCGLDCDISDLGWTEFLLLIAIFITVFVVTRKAINYFKNNDSKNT